MAEKIVLEPGKTTNSEFKTNKIGEPITIKPGDIKPYEAFTPTEELMRRIVEAENVALKNEIEANAVVVNGRKYGMLKNYRGLPPTVFGMRLETKIDMPDDWDFFIQQRPPLPNMNPTKNVYLSESNVAALGGAEEVESHLDNGWHLVVVPDHVPKEEE